MAIQNVPIRPHRAGSVRDVVKIDEEKCTGCGECVPACAEGAIRIVDGVAKLVADHLCDGLGACLGECPEGAISIEQREADAFDEVAVKQHLSQQAGATTAVPAGDEDPEGHRHMHGVGGGCPGARMLHHTGPSGGTPAPRSGDQPSELRQWPVQLHLLSPTAPYFTRADLLLTADCVAFAMGNFHRDHLRGHSLAVACPKLDQGQEIYLHKLVTMIEEAELNLINVMVMEVPCCAGLVRLAQEAAARAGRKVPVKKTVVGLQGDIVAEEWL